MWLAFNLNELNICLILTRTIIEAYIKYRVYFDDGCLIQLYFQIIKKIPEMEFMKMFSF